MVIFSASLLNNILLALLCIFCQISILKCEDLAQSDTLSDKQILEFLRDGWTTVPQAVPQFKDSNFRKSVDSAHSIARLNFVLTTFRYLKVHKDIDCADYKSTCGPWDPSYYEYRGLSSESVTERTHKGMTFLNCCIFASKERPADAHKDAGFPYFQALNPHRFNDDVFSVAVSRRLGYLAAQLLQHSQVRLYQTAVFHKSADTLNQDTGWHQDLNMIPLDTGSNGYLTFWCPLQRLEVAANDSLLVFAEGSHRDMARVHWYPSEMDYAQRNVIIKDRYVTRSAYVLSPGDCTAHSGWVYHKAHPQPKARGSRTAIGFGFVTNKARVLPDLHGNTSRFFRPFTFEDEASFSPWIQDLRPMTHINHPMLPLVYNGGLWDDDIVRTTSHQSGNSGADVCTASDGGGGSCVGITGDGDGAGGKQDPLVKSTRAKKRKLKKKEKNI